MEAAPPPMFAMLSPDETALDVVRRARKATVRTGFPPLDPYLGGAEVRPGDFVEVVGEYGTGKSTLLLQCVVDAVLPKCLGGQGASVMWVDFDMKFCGERLREMLGYEVMARCATGAYPEAGKAVSPEVIESIRASADPARAAMSEAEATSLDDAIEAVVEEALASVVVFVCESTTHLMATLAAAEARLALRRRQWALLVIDAISAMQHIWRVHEPMGGDACYMQVLRSTRRLRKVYGITLLVARVEAGRGVEVGEEAAWAALDAIPVSTAGCLSAAAAALYEAREAAAAAMDSSGNGGADDRDDDDHDDDAGASDKLGSAASGSQSAADRPAPLPATAAAPPPCARDPAAARAAADAVSSLFRGTRSPWDLSPRVWLAEATHKVRLMRVVPSWSASSDRPFAYAEGSLFLARLLRAPGLEPAASPLSPPTSSSGFAAASARAVAGSPAARLPLRQLWLYRLALPGLVEASADDPA
ncbi:hypothetical protein FNF28_04041 [Cafeteria roenbergensis]|uniref:Rad51-like C-terminal domain-containing protein n=1 Tax=Cafeteria roenbergensis TaxID=33653 RepID=A0A5A8DF41_CAFRO|nr:hypothetical protein FNF28_04041 [Cafeteria roenbergensis]